jgi:hypothetical protein
MDILRRAAEHLHDRYRSMPGLVWQYDRGDYDAIRLLEALRTLNEISRPKGVTSKTGYNFYDLR